MITPPNPQPPAASQVAGSPVAFPPPEQHDRGTAAAEASKRSVPAVLVIMAVVVLLVGGTWWAGGFERASGRFYRLPPGTEVSMGPLSIALDRALARNSFGSWSIYALGRCRNNTDAPLVSTEDRLVSNGFSMQHPVTKQIVGDASLYFGPGETIGSSVVLNPGTPMVPCALAFLVEDFPGTDVVSLGVSQLEWIDRSPTGEGDMVWSAARIGYQFELPLVTDPGTDP